MDREILIMFFIILGVILLTTTLIPLMFDLILGKLCP